ncbi:MAG: efflux RND transporter permease subunit [Pseudomonadota bacterium]
MLNFLLRRAAQPWLTLLFATLLTAVAAALCVDWQSGSFKLKVDPAMERLLPAQDADRAVYERAREVFGDTDPVLLSVRFEDGVFKAENLARIAELAARLRELPGVSDVFSLESAPNLISADEALEVSSFTKQAAAYPERIGELAAQLAANPIYRSTLVSQDGKEAAFALTLRGIDETTFRLNDYPLRFEQTAQAVLPNAVVRVTGAPVIKRATADALLATLEFTLPAVFAVITLVLLFAFRDLRLVLAGVITVGVSLVGTMALLVLMGWKVHLLTALTPALVVTQGLCYCIHWLSDFTRNSDGREPAARAQNALKHSALPLLLNAVTAIAGFVALLVTPLPAIHQFAVLTAFGILLSMLASLTLLPALTLVLGCRSSRNSQISGVYDRIATALARYSIKWRGVILGVALLLLAIGGVLATQLESGTEFVRSFPEDSKVRQDYEAINTAYGGANVLTVLIETHVADALTDPALIAQVDALAQWLRQQPEVGAVYSYVDLVKLLNRSLGDGRPEDEVVPQSAAAVKQILIFAGGEQVRQVLDAQYKTTAVVVRVTVDDARELAAFADRVDRRLTALPQPLSAHLTGSSLLATRTADQLTGGQWASVALTALLIWLILSVIFTSPRAAALALLPNLVPVAIYYGLLQLTGIGLTPTTSLIASIVLGISVDDTIHYMVRFNKEARARGSEVDAVRHALSEVLRPITLTMLALCLGFLVFTGADMESQVQFGLLAAFTLFLSWVSDITLTPALASMVRIVTLWDILRLDLGQSPQHTIPLLSGLSLRQARTFALLSRLEKHPAGSRVITEGDYARDMYVIVDGQVEAWVLRHEERKSLSTMSRGAVMGEAGYFGQRRTANIDALSAVRLLRFDSQDLERLRLRHPRIAATIFRNLNRIQAERIARMTAML